VDRGPYFPTGKVDAVQKEIAHEFSDLSDFIWKLPQFIETQEIIEREKLDAMFPVDGDDFTKKLREIRFYLEFSKIYIKFPTHLAASTLFLASSFFEGWLIRIAKKFESELPISFNQIDGKGFKKLVNFFQRNGVDFNKFHHMPQIHAAIKIRNCLSHAYGFIDHSRDHVEIRRIIDRGIFRTDDHPMPYDPETDSPLVKIIPSDWGDSLTISPEYGFLASSYFHEATHHVYGSLKGIMESLRA